MMQRFFSWPVRVHLTILIALLAVPSICLIVYSGVAARRQAIAGAKAECLKFVNDVAGRQQAIVAAAEQLGTALALLPPIQSRNPAAVSGIFSELLKKNPQYANIAVSDNSDLVWASAIPLEGKVSVADRRFVREAARTGMFSSGEYVVGRIAKKPVMSFGYPVKNTAHGLIAVLGIILDLDYSQHMFERLHLPPGSSFSLLDHRGTILTRYLDDPFSEKLLGSRDTREELFTRMTEGPEEGTYEAMGNDGRFRLVAYKRIGLPWESTPYMYIRSSIPLASATRAANAAMFKNLSVFASLFLFGLLLAWYIGKRVIVRPAMMLKGASEQLAAGAGTVHVSRVVKGGELGEVARAFDGMAEALVQRETALRESEERWATTLASIGDAVIATDVAGRTAFMNTVAEELTGWTLREASMKPVTEVFKIINEQTRGAVESPVAKVLREGTVVGLANHAVLVRKDGTETPIDDSGAPIRDRHGNTMGVVLVFRDITKRKQADEAVHTTLQRFYTLLSSMYTALLLVTDESRVEFANQALCDYFDLTDSPADLVGLTSFEIFARISKAYLYPDEAIARIKEIVGRGQPVKGEEVAMRDGRELLRDFIPIHVNGKSYGRCGTTRTSPSASTWRKNFGSPVMGWSGACTNEPKSCRMPTRN
jgi:PAS domain S-box-containing protein